MKYQSLSTVLITLLFFSPPNVSTLTNPLSLTDVTALHWVTGLKILCLVNKSFEIFQSEMRRDNITLERHRLVLTKVFNLKSVL